MATLSSSWPGRRAGAVPPDRRLADRSPGSRRRAGARDRLLPALRRLLATSAGIAQLAHRQKLEHPVLDVLQGVVVFLQDPRSLPQVQMVLGPDVPGQLGNVLEVGPDDLRLHRLAANPLQPAKLAVDLLARVGGKVEGRKLLLELFQLAHALLIFAQLLADLLELLAQEHLPLPLAQLLLDLRLDVLLGIDHADLPLDVHQHAPQPLLHRQRLQQRLPLRRSDVDVAGHQVRKLAGLVHPGQYLLDHFLRQSRLLAELRRPGSSLPMQRHECRLVRTQGKHFLRLADDRLEIAVFLGIVEGDAALLAVQQELHPGEAPLHLPDTGDGADGIQDFGGHALDVLPLGDREYDPVRGGERSFDCAQRAGTPSADRRGDARKENDLPKGKHRQCEAFSHLSYYSSRLPSRANDTSNQDRSLQASAVPWRTTPFAVSFNNLQPRSSSAPYIAGRRLPLFCRTEPVACQFGLAARSSEAGMNPVMRPPVKPTRRRVAFCQAAKADSQRPSN